MRECLFVVPTAREAERLVAREGISRGCIWTALELADLLIARPNPADFSAVALAKLALDGEVVAVAGTSILTMDTGAGSRIAQDATHHDAGAGNRCAV